MDGHDRGHRLLAALLAGDLSQADARVWDEHLLECEQCWGAVREDRAGRQSAQLLRQPPPPGLADRVGLAVELAAAGTIARERPRHGMRLRWPWLVATAALAAIVAVTVAVLLPGRRKTPAMPAAVAAVARYAQQLPPPGIPGLARDGRVRRRKWATRSRWPQTGSRWCCGCGGWATRRRWSLSPPSPSPCPPVPMASPARAWRGPRDWEA